MSKLHRLLFAAFLALGAIPASVNAGPPAFDNAIADLTEFDRRWPQPLRRLISGRHPPQGCEALLVHRPPGIKHVISFA